MIEKIKLLWCRIVSGKINEAFLNVVLNTTTIDKVFFVGWFGGDEDL